ncbi:MAG: ROK family protein [Bryobacterales bacterium]|nr:ROK family protein [Bryobacterales bacterium]
MNTLFALDIGGTQIKAARVSESGQLLSLRKVPTPPTLDAFRSVASSLAAEFGPGAIAAGIGCKGRIDEDSTRVLVLPGTLRYLEGHALRDIFQLGSLPVKADNDARVALRGETRWGALQGFSDAIMLTLGTGVGGGVVSGGRILHGASGLAGHLGHYTVHPDGELCICGNRGCLETLFSAKALEAAAYSVIHRGTASTLLDKAPQPSCADVFHAAQSGDPAAHHIVHRAVLALGAALAGLVFIFDPQIIVLGGQIADAGDFLLLPLRQIVHDRTYAMLRRDVPIVRTSLDDPSGLLGAAALALEAAAKC